MTAAKTVAIVGAGHNGLTAAAYLAKAGYSVDVFEKRDTLGGLCVTEKPFAKFGSEVKVSTVASYFGMLRKEIFQELNLEEHGLKPYLTNPIEIVLLDGGQFSFTPREAGEGRSEIASLTDSDKEGWQRFWCDMQKAAAIIYPGYLDSSLTQKQVEALLLEAKLDKIAAHIFDGSLLDLLKLYVASEDLMAVAATCTPGFVNLVGSVFGCIHHGTAETAGEFGAWGQVYGGMGEITQALAKVAQVSGARLHTGCAVRSLANEGERITAIEFENGEKQSFDIVIANCDSYVLFEKLLSKQPATQTVRDYLSENRPKVSAAKLHFLLKAMPAFTTLKKIDHNHKGVIVVAPPLNAVKQASQTVPAGAMPERLMLTMAFPTLEDPSMAAQKADKNASGGHVLTVDVHYVPAKIGENAWSEKDDDVLLEMTIAAIEEQCPEIRQLIAHSYVVSPRVLAEVFNLASLSCWHLPMTPQYLFEKRSLPDCAPYETPFANLYICGAGTYPGGNVTAVNGHNLAKHLLAKQKAEAKQEVPCQLQA